MPTTTNQWMPPSKGFMDTTTIWTDGDSEWHWEDKDVDVVTNVAKTIMNDTAESLVLEYQEIMHPTHSNIATTGTTVLAEDMMQIIMATTVMG